VDVSITVVDTAFGRLAEDVEVALLHEVDTAWRQEVGARTDEAGRAVIHCAAPARGRYRLVIDLDRYFTSLGATPLQSRVDITFRVFSLDGSIPFMVAVTPSSSSVVRMSAGG
jgi:5-hydroxyisourate hydrolase-like protein (transthyretin family)